MGLEDLKQISARLHQPKYPHVVLDFSTHDDCGAVCVGSSLLVQSVDVIPPVVDDPYLYGQIASANALSDIFAKGARALSAMNLLMWDQEHLDQEDIDAILQGGLSKLIECACPLIGGHSLYDREQKYGLSVTGVVQKELWRNNSAQVGDVIVLTKPLGSGILSTASKKRVWDFDPHVAQVMATLNLTAMECAQQFSVHACTDVSGFGLLGHLSEMLNAHISIEVDTSCVCLFDHVLELAQRGIFAGGSAKNKQALQACVANKSTLPDIIFYDAQTSGGLLVALEPSEAKHYVNMLRDLGMRASIVASCVPKATPPLVLY